jgi:Fe-S cluster assembly iron-binding protein IscA
LGHFQCLELVGVIAVVGVEDGGSDGFEGEQDPVGGDDLFDEADGELDVDVAGGGCDGFEFVLEVDDSVEVAGGAVLECVDESGGLASDTAVDVGDGLAEAAAVSEGGLEVGVAGTSAVVDGVGVTSHFVSHFLGVVRMMRAAQIVIRTTQIPERRRISVSLICGLR